MVTEPVGLADGGIMRGGRLLVLLRSGVAVHAARIGGVGSGPSLGAPMFIRMSTNRRDIRSSDSAGQQDRVVGRQNLAGPKADTADGHAPALLNVPSYETDLVAVAE